MARNARQSRTRNSKKNVTGRTGRTSARSRRSSSARSRRSASSGSTAASERRRSAPARTRRSASSRTGRTASPGTRETGSRLARTTTDHDEIRQWAEERGGRPACVKGTGGPDDIGMIRIEFPGAPNSRDESLQEIEWEEFFEKFDERGLALVYEGRTASGQKSNFSKLIKRETPRARAAGAGR
jgi:hypothetical protein